VISPIKKGIIGVAHLNQQLQAVLNPPGPDKNERTLGPIVFREGDKVMQVRNNYQLRWEDREAVDEGEGIYNGDIGRIMHISTQAKVVTVRFSDGKWVHYDFEQLDELTHAFAMTVHKSQGSEFPVVIMPMVGGSPMFLNRKLLYTGVTRAKRMIILVGNFDHFVRMIRAGSSRERRTGLKARIACYEAIKL
jgi:exodeoxyribonuclease V alpha subunit